MDQTSTKHQIASDVVNKPFVVINTQVINEVCFNLRRKAGYTEGEIRQTLDNFQQSYPIFTVTIDIVRKASRLRETLQRIFSYYWRRVPLKKKY